MSPEDYPSNEEALLNSDIEEILQVNASKLDILLADDLSTASIAINGILKSSKGYATSVAMVVYSDSEQRLTAISLANKEYTVSDEGVIDQEDDGFTVGEDEIMKIRFWLRETQWGMGRFSLPFQVDT